MDNNNMSEYSSRPPSLIVDEAIVATNTILATNIPSYSFDKSSLSYLRTHFEQFGNIKSFIPLKSFSRVMIVYSETDYAIQAKSETNRLCIHQNEIRVYFGPHTGTLTPSTQSRNRLRPPENEKNWLISPPGSPPAGWEQIKDHAPNKVVLPDDLIMALSNLSCSTPTVVLEPVHEKTTATPPSVVEGSPDIYHMTRPFHQEMMVDEPVANDDQDPANPKFNFIINTFISEDDSELHSLSLPSILVEDWDGSNPMQGEQNLIARANAFRPTSMPSYKKSTFNAHKATILAMSHMQATA